MLQKVDPLPLVLKADLVAPTIFGSSMVASVVVEPPVDLVVVEVEVMLVGGHFAFVPYVTLSIPVLQAAMVGIKVTVAADGLTVRRKGRFFVQIIIEASDTY